MKFNYHFNEHGIGNLARKKEGRKVYKFSNGLARFYAIHAMHLPTTAVGEERKTNVKRALQLI